MAELVLNGVDKIYRGKKKAVHAVKSLSLTVKSGEIVALLGENGAGKSTLMNVLNGLYKPDSGMISVKGQPSRFSSPRDAIAAGIGMVHQHFMLVPVLTVWENMIMGLPGLEPVLPRKEVVEKIRALSERYGLRVEPKPGSGSFPSGSSRGSKSSRCFTGRRRPLSWTNRLPC